MKQNNLNWFIVVVCVVAWALYQINPPTAQSLISTFAAKGQKQDDNFKAIVSLAKTYEATGTNSEFAALQLAVGTNDLQKYFPTYN
ncbi:MAG TPA: hypothetical protein VF607_10720, partial [Verrucomicrobiae bacterium]